MKINKVYLIIFFVFFLLESCSGQQPSNEQQTQNISIRKGIDTTKFDKNHIETNFPLVTIDVINNRKFHPFDEFNYDIPYSILSDVFLIPVNEIEYPRVYIKNIFKTLYGYKVSNNLWLLAYYLHYDQHYGDVVWSLYNSELKKVTSKLVVSSSTLEFDRRLKYFDGKKIVIYSKYKRHFQNGFEGDNSKPVEVESTYIIQNDKFVAQ